MNLAAELRSRIKAARKRGALWARVVDVLRLVPTAEGRARLWMRLIHRDEVHQTTPQTAEERYPKLFDLAAELAGDASRILSFGCSTGEELVSLRRRFPAAELVGAEINPRSRSIARRKLASDENTKVLPPSDVRGPFDIIFALAVFQREPHKIAEMEVANLSGIYPFGRFDSALRHLVGQLRPGGLLCVDKAMYRVEDSTAARQLVPVKASPALDGLLFGRDGRRLGWVTARTMFRKRAPAAQPGGARRARRPAS